MSKTSNPRFPSAEGFVRGGEQKNRERRPQSSITTMKRVDPDNPYMANHQVNFVCDFTEQKAVVPDGMIKGLARNENRPPRTMNASGKPAHALPGIVVGAGQDDKGNF